MQQKTFIFTGRSGVGKGTQTQLLKEYLQKKHPNTNIVSFGSGENLRKLIKGSQYTARRVKDIVYDKGGLFPEFLAIFNWANFFIEHITGDEFLLIDGSPRKLREAKVLDEAFDFYGKKEVYVLLIEGSREWSTKLLVGRGRSDDTPGNIKRRLDWFEEDVVETIEYYKKHHKHTIIEINAEQTREAVHKEIISKLEL